MRLTEFHRLVTGEFGDTGGDFVVHSHVLADHGKTGEELLECGIDPAVVWAALCEDFQVPPERRLGPDEP